MVLGLTRGWARVAGAAEGDASPDVQILQTATSVDNAAVEAYDAALQLAVIGGPDAHPGVNGLFRAARAHHADHVLAYDDALDRLGAPAPGAANAAVAALFRPAGSALRAVAEAMLAVESVAAQTFQLAVGLLEDGHARSVAAAVAGTEFQHVAALAVLREVAGGDDLELFTLGDGAGADFPEALASVAFPDAFTTTDEARPPGEGATG